MSATLEMNNTLAQLSDDYTWELNSALEEGREDLAWELAAEYERKSLALLT